MLSPNSSRTIANMIFSRTSGKGRTCRWSAYGSEISLEAQANTKLFKVLDLTNGFLTLLLQVTKCKHHQRSIPACGVKAHKLDEYVCYNSTQIHSPLPWPPHLKDALVLSSLYDEVDDHMLKLVVNLLLLLLQEAGELFPDWGHTSGDLIVDQNGILVSIFLRALQANYIVSDLSVETWLILSEFLESLTS